MDAKLGLNPWLSMWIRPKNTIQTIIDYNPNYRLFWLSALYGFISLISSAQTLSLGYKLNFFVILIISLLLSWIWGYVLFSVSSFFVYFSGRWVGGQGTYKEIRSALAWSNVVQVGNVILWVLLFLLFGNSLFTNFPGGYVLNTFLFSILFVILLCQLILSVWMLVLYINALAQVQKFSIGKSILNLIIAVIIMLGIFFIIFAIAGVIQRALT